MEQLLGKNIRISGDIYEVEAHHGDHLLLRLKESSAPKKPKKKKEKKKNKSVTIKLGKNFEKSIPIKKKLKSAKQLGYSTYENLDYPDDLLDEAYEELLDIVNGDKKVTIKFFEEGVLDKIVDIELDIASFDGSDHSKIILISPNGDLEKINTKDVLTSMVFTQECLVVQKVFDAIQSGKLSGGGISNSQEAVEDNESASNQTPDDALETILNNLLQPNGETAIEKDLGDLIDILFRGR